MDANGCVDKTSSLASIFNINAETANTQQYSAFNMSMDRNNQRDSKYELASKKRKSSKKRIKVDLSNQAFVKDKERISKMIKKIDKICQRSDIPSESSYSENINPNQQIAVQQVTESDVVLKWEKDEFIKRW